MIISSTIGFIPMWDELKNENMLLAGGRCGVGIGGRNKTPYEVRTRNVRNVGEGEGEGVAMLAFLASTLVCPHVSVWT